MASPSKSGRLSLVLAVLAWVVGAVASSTARAEDTEEKIVVRAGDSRVIERTAKSIADATATHGNVTNVPQGSGAAVTNVLVYVPPPGVDEIDDSVHYTVGGETVSRNIAVKRASVALTDPDFYEASFKVLFALMILAVIVENGLAIIFRWRPFLVYFDPRAMNPLVAFVFSLFFVRAFHLDVATSLINIYSVTKHPDNWSGMLLTAAIIAGGSAAVNRVFQALGFRAVSAQETPVQKPPRTEAWIAVSLKRDKAKGPVDVHLGDAGKDTVVGTIAGATKETKWWQFFTRDKGRFPQTGGISVALGKSYEVWLTGTDGTNKITSSKWGPYEPGPGALVDIELTL